jgi:hypothetical protein
MALGGRHGHALYGLRPPFLWVRRDSARERGDDLIEGLAVVGEAGTAREP